MRKEFQDRINYARENLGQEILFPGLAHKFHTNLIDDFYQAMVGMHRDGGWPKASADQMIISGAKPTPQSKLPDFHLDPLGYQSKELEDIGIQVSTDIIRDKPTYNFRYEFIVQDIRDHLETVSVPSIGTIFEACFVDGFYVYKSRRLSGMPLGYINYVLTNPKEFKLVGCDSFGHEDYAVTPVARPNTKLATDKRAASLSQVNKLIVDDIGKVLGIAYGGKWDALRSPELFMLAGRVPKKRPRVTKLTGDIEAAWNRIRDIEDAVKETRRQQEALLNRIEDAGGDKAFRKKLAEDFLDAAILQYPTLVNDENKILVGLAKASLKGGV